MTPLVDSFGRVFEYLRLSLEDACNFRCVYCLPDGHHKAQEQPPLCASEIGRLARAFSGMGVWKVRLTGGEPTMRRDLIEVARLTAEAPGVRRLALSTNGHRLAELAGPLQQAGVGCVNVSVDSLKPARFAKLTGRNALPGVLEGVHRCLSLGLETKINAVLLKDGAQDELDDFLALTRSQPLGVRFIELMRTGDNAALFETSHVSAQGLLLRLAERGWMEVPRRAGDGPARRFTKAGHAGSVGVIAPYAKDFCSTCNRLRVTSRGGLRLCLFADSDFSLRHLLQDDGSLGELQHTVRGLLARKEASHYLPEGRFGNARHFAMMGG
jgi:cyclic pyranopterin phosphate synthase